MKMLEISKSDFENFAKSYPYFNYLQTENYGITMKTFGYDYSFVAYTNNDDKMLAAGMFLTKELNKKYKYAYCPGGYLIDYNNPDLVRRFTNNLKKYYRSKKVIFLKTNPSIDIAKIDQLKDYETNTNSNNDIIETLKNTELRKPTIKPSQKHSGLTTMRLRNWRKCRGRRQGVLPKPGKKEKKSREGGRKRERPQERPQERPSKDVRGSCRNSRNCRTGKTQTTSAAGS